MFLQGLNNGPNPVALIKKDPVFISDGGDYKLLICL